MNFGIVEVLALILIAITAIKLLFFLVNPQWWYSFIEKVYSNPPITSLITFVLAMVVLYFLVLSGISIVDILAVSLFIALLITIGLAKYTDKLIPWVREQNIVLVLKEIWLYTLVWLLLIAWGAGELLIG